MRIPSTLSPAQERTVVAELVARVERKRAVRDAVVDVDDRARVLADRYDLPRAASVRWVTNQQSRWGSCSFEAGEIRISARLAKAPLWVLDYVLLHELTHLVEPNHGPRFHELMARYPKGERAEGFLDAMSLGFADSAYTID